VASADVRRSLGLKIGELRQQKGMTQGALAKRAGITVQFVSLIEKGESTTNPTIDTLISIAEALEVEVRVLFEKPDGTYQAPRRGRPKRPAEP
jgi:transcriptional regulator with XRE-family HTH domain